MCSLIVKYSSLADLPVRILDMSHIGHIGNKGSGEMTMAKTFVDFFVMSRALRVYRIVAKELYPSGFCEYAAKMGDIQLIDVRL